MPEAETPLAPAAVAERLSAELPAWRMADGAIRRTIRTGGWKATLMAVNAIGHLAEAAWHHPDLAISYDRIHIALSTHSAGGVTGKDFALARKIEEVVLWRPQDEGGPLEGIPADPRFTYLETGK